MNAIVMTCADCASYQIARYVSKGADSSLAIRAGHQDLRMQVRPAGTGLRRTTTIRHMRV